MSIAVASSNENRPEVPFSPFERGCASAGMMDAGAPPDGSAAASRGAARCRSCSLMRAGRVRRPRSSSQPSKGDELGAEIGQHLAPDPVDELAPAGDDAGDHIAMAADIFGGGVDDEVAAERYRLLEDRRRPAVVDDA